MQSGWQSGDRVTRVTYRRAPGYFQRVGNSACGACFGFFFVVAAFPLLFWNEGRAVQTAQSLDEGLASCIRLHTTDMAFDSNQNRLIHLSGVLTTQTAVEDTSFGVKLYAVRLERYVEMYQWEESSSTHEYKEPNGDTRQETTYSYHRTWKSHVVNSNHFQNRFAHQNPSSMPISPSSFKSPSVQVGTFTLSAGLRTRLNQEHTVSPQSIAGLRLQRGQQISGDYVYQGNTHNHQIGDVRISWKYAGCSQTKDGLTSDCMPEQVSIIARQQGSFLAPYQTRAGDTFELLYYGVQSAESMFTQEHQANTMFTWGLRGVGFLVMLIGFSLITSIITEIVSFIPIVRELVSFGVTIFNVCLSLSLSLFVIAIGWLRYRPALSLTLLAIGALPYLLARMTSKKHTDEHKRM